MGCVLGFGFVLSICSLEFQFISFGFGLFWLFGFVPADVSVLFFLSGVLVIGSLSSFGSGSQVAFCQCARDPLKLLIKKISKSAHNIQFNRILVNVSLSPANYIIPMQFVLIEFFFFFTSENVLIGF